VPRPTPFDLVFVPLAAERFPAIQAAISRSGRDPRDRDAFLLQRETVELIRVLRPDEGVGEAMDQLSALVHHAFLFWSAGQRVTSVDEAQLALALDAASAPRAAPPDAVYVQLPELRVWAQALAEDAHEPLDGCFVSQAPSGPLRVLGVLGLHPDRAGLTVVEVEGTPPASLARPDGSAPFSSVLPGGDTARLYSVAGAPELLEIGWRLGALTASPSDVAAPR
jgi:hypothetical protein